MLSTHLTQGSSPNAVRLDGYLLQVVELSPHPETTDSIARSDDRLTLRIESS